jgi:hypothetical protein
LKDRVSGSCTGKGLAGLGYPEEKLLSGMFLELIVLVLDDVLVDLMPFGNILTTIGRSAGMLTQIIPILHSITERLRPGTLSTVDISKDGLNPRQCWLAQQLT